VSQLLCRHDFGAVEHVADSFEPVTASRIVYELRSTRCGKMKRVVCGEHLPVDTAEEAAGRRPKLPR
jgi:hypothetical protein